MEELRISRKKIEKAVRDAVKEGKDFCSYDNRRYFAVMIDTSDGDIWLDVFIDCNSWNRYHSKSIMRLDCFPYYDIVTGYIENAVEELKKAGWTIEA